MVHFATSSEEFHTTLSANKVVIVDYTASWCPPCKMIAPVFEKLSVEFTDITFLKVDVDDLQEVSAWAEIQAMPTFIVYVDGKQADLMRGANPQASISLSDVRMSLLPVSMASISLNPINVSFLPITTDSTGMTLAGRQDFCPSGDFHFSLSTPGTAPAMSINLQTGHSASVRSSAVPKNASALAESDVNNIENFLYSFHITQFTLCCNNVLHLQTVLWEKVESQALGVAEKVEVEQQDTKWIKENSK
ncbi:hypothetical protein HK096_003810 [Nowakowskiella sp. JEL0078]|nr:hypothetical protein HK096_003810 [Nowakowskiella sp. JEL0078]